MPVAAEDSTAPTLKRSQDLDMKTNLKLDYRQPPANYASSR
ncbi:MAG: hypothetical protein QGG54_08995 [Gammaproteobacteria bacterium]|nr:hypothetical protein [Gammaproteobacteria bacterium]